MYYKKIKNSTINSTINKINVEITECNRNTDNVFYEIHYRLYLSNDTNISLYGGSTIDKQYKILKKLLIESKLIGQAIPLTIFNTFKKIIKSKEKMMN
jgi:hypothetical protein